MFSGDTIVEDSCEALWVTLERNPGCREKRMATECREKEIRIKMRKRIENK